jgi:hypothetical protein
MAKKLSYWIVAFVLIQSAIDTLRRRFFGCAERYEEDVNGRTVVITGANSGLGKTTALEMAKRGATVVLGRYRVSQIYLTISNSVLQTNVIRS